jgi:unsaturated rhamnogalacturonyl hydrolase
MARRFALATTHAALVMIRLMPTLPPLRVAALTLTVLVSSASAQFDFGPWAPGTSPQEVGQRVAAHFVASRHPDFGRPTRPERISYPEVCTWYGALTFSQLTHDGALKAALVKRFEPLVGPTKWPDHKDADANGMLDERDLVPVPDHVDHTVFAAVPFELYIQTKDKRYLELGQTMADWQWSADPVVKWPFKHPILEKHFPNRVGKDAKKWIDQGYSWQTRLWIDDMFMITMAQAQAFRATGDRKYIDRAAKEMVLYLDTLQEPNGLFYHTRGVPYFWGRGDGWMAAGMAELLRSLPQDNPDRARIMKGYKLMMASLLKYQDEKGMWHQLIDDPQSWPESSCTGMFTSAFITGVKEGWLDQNTYGPAAKKAWLAVITYLDENADIHEVCQGTNVYDPKTDPTMGPDGRAYYLARQRITGDMHGQAPLLWCASALLR